MRRRRGGAKRKGGRWTAEAWAGVEEGPAGHIHIIPLTSAEAESDAGAATSVW